MGASTGECEKNPGWMLDNCRKSCNNCNTGPSTNPPVITQPTPGPTSCRDVSSDCETRVTSGECTSNRSYMMENCKKSCGECRPPILPVTTPPTTTTTTTTTTTKAACQNKDERCIYWASY